MSSHDQLVQNFHAKFTGELAIRNTLDFNKALLTKKVWKIFSNPRSLYSRVMSGKYSVSPNSDRL